MAGLVKNRAIEYQRIPNPGGMTGMQASTVYRWGAKEYGELPMPATQYVTSTSALSGSEVVPSVAPAWTNAPIVNRRNRRKGYIATGGLDPRNSTVPQQYKPPYISKFQELYIGQHINYIKNAELYRAGYPAATVMNGGRHNLALSTRVDQLVTRSSGGPGPAAMQPAPRFAKTQNVPRYSTMPQQYPTQSAPG